jgi:hypothetical protein
MLRVYWPKETDPSILNGTWNPPAVQRTEDVGRQQVCADLSEGPDATRERVLVRYHVRDRSGLVVFSQSAEPVYSQSEEQPQLQCAGRDSAL